MKFTVDGADRMTGIERSIEVEAPDEREAETIARRHADLVVADVKPKHAQALNYRGPDVTKPDVPLVRDRDRYADIDRGQATFNTIADICFAVAFVTTMCGFVAGLFAFNESNSRTMLIIVAASSFVTALAYVALGFVLKWLGAVGSAIKDIAKNTTPE